MWNGIADLLNYFCSVFAYHLLLGNMILGSKIPLLQQALPYDKRVQLHIYSTSALILFTAYHAFYKLIYGYSLIAERITLIILILIMLSAALIWIALPGSGILLVLVYVSAVISFVLSKLPAGRTSAVVSSLSIAEHIVTLSVRTKRQYLYKSGQFSFIRIPGVRGEHPFSYLSAHGDDKFAARIIGRFTKNLENLHQDDKISLSGAFGNFRPQDEKYICLIGSGIGAVPIVSLLKEFQKVDEKRMIKAFLSVNTREELPEYSTLEGMGK